MKLPTSALFVVRRDDATLFVRSGRKASWTLPGGNPGRKFSSFKAFAQSALGVFYDGLTVISLRLLARPKGEIVICDKRVQCSVFECTIIGLPKDRMRRRMCFMNLGTVPQSAVSSDISGIVGILQSGNPIRLSA